MSTSKSIDEVLDNTESILGVRPDYRIKRRPDGDYFIIEVAAPSDRFFSLVEKVSETLPEENQFKDRITVQARLAAAGNRLELVETQLLQRELSQSLTVDSNTFGDDFLSRYTASVTNHERVIIGNANFIVFGRRGAGKSSLLAYAMHKLRQIRHPFCWIPVQTYSGRKDEQAVASLLADIVREVRATSDNPAELEGLHNTLQALGESDDGNIRTKIERLVPRLRVLLGSLATRDKPLTIFLDDIHVLDESLQPRLLGTLYAACRDNNIYIKASGIEQFTRLWDARSNFGLQAPHDAQTLKLDYNLTMPDRSKEHIVGILDAHAKYCGLGKVGYLADDNVLSRLVLVAAAVPRDALSLFSQAITKSLMKGQKAISVTSVNAAASETVEAKIQDIQRDLFDGREEVSSLLDKIKEFCISQERKNAFLVKIDNRSRGFLDVQKLVALRLVHVLHEGITPHKAGERFVALMLDFGFYVGIRAAKSVQLFPERPQVLLARDLRRLPIFDPD